MKELDHSELLTVLGGSRTTAAVSRRADSTLEHALTTLASDIKQLTRPRRSNMQTMIMMAAAVAMTKRA
ncbi:MAG TPA: hypothetical protein VIV11_12350 [Kofleriaceae bacterium]